MLPLPSAGSGTDTADSRPAIASADLCGPHNGGVHTRRTRRQQSVRSREYAATTTAALARILPIATMS